MRYCEHGDCTYYGDMDGMVRMPTGEWYCLEHALLVDCTSPPARLGRVTRDGRGNPTKEDNDATGEMDDQDTPG